MAAIQELIAQIGDARLHERLAAEWAKATRERKFGLVFEGHRPELLPLPKARPRRGDSVCVRGGALKNLWHVSGCKGGRVQCQRPQPGIDGATADSAELALNDLMVVRESGEPIFPALVPVDAVANGGADAPWHTLIEADNYHALQLLEYLYEGRVDCVYIDPPYNSGARDWNTSTLTLMGPMRGGAQRRPQAPGRWNCLTRPARKCGRCTPISSSCARTRSG